MPSAHRLAAGCVTVTGAAVEHDRRRRRPARSRRAPARRRCGARRPGRRSPAPRRRAARTRCPGTRPSRRRSSHREPHLARARAASRVKSSTTSRPTISRMAAAGVSSRAGRGRDPAAVAQDRDPVGDLEDLLHAVRDEEDRHALAGAGCATMRKSCAHLVRRQRAVGSSMIRTRTSSEIALAISTVCCSARVRPRAGSPTSSRTSRRARTSSASRSIRRRSTISPAVAVADEDVLRDRQVGEDHRLLVDRGDA